MSPLRPRTHLQTHDVVNQPPSFEDVNLFTTDRALQGAVAAAGGAAHHERLASFGARAGSSEVQEWAMLANRNPPQLRIFDRYGARLVWIATFTVLIAGIRHFASRNEAPARLLAS